ncbi:MAG: hypothetical protein ACREMY_26035 [bacterium]
MSGIDSNPTVNPPVNRMVDVTSTDPYEIARLWGVEVTATTGGLLALPVRERCFVRTPGGTMEGDPGDVLLVSNQQMKRRIIPADLFYLIFGEVL